MVTDEWLRETEMYLALYCAGAVFLFGWLVLILGEIYDGANEGKRNGGAARIPSRLDAPLEERHQLRIKQGVDDDG